MSKEHHGLSPRVGLQASPMDLTAFNDGKTLVASSAAHSVIERFPDKVEESFYVWPKDDIHQ